MVFLELLVAIVVIHHGSQPETNTLVLVLLGCVDIHKEAKKSEKKKRKKKGRSRACWGWISSRQILSLNLNSLTYFENEPIFSIRLVLIT